MLHPLFRHKDGTQRKYYCLLLRAGQSSAQCMQLLPNTLTQEQEILFRILQFEGILLTLIKSKNNRINNGI